MPGRNPTDTLKFGENWGIKFYIKTGGQSYECTLQEHASYERMKASFSRNGSISSISSVDSTMSTASDKSS